MKATQNKVRASAGHVVVISQLPPPVHGSTVMTEVFLGSLDRLNLNWTLVDRRFSASIDRVGKISFRKILAAIGLALRLVMTIIEKRPTKIIFFCTTRLVSFLVDWILSEVIRLFRTPTVHYIHTQGYGDLANRNIVLRFMVRRLLGVASKTVCLSPSLYADIAPWVSSDSVTFIANTPRDSPSEARERDESPRRVTFLSNLISGKGIDTFIEMAVRLADDHPDVVFDVVGAPSNQLQVPLLQERVRESGLTGRFNFAGAVHGDEKWGYLQRSSLLVFPSQLIEAQPLTIIEAFACGTPVAAFGVGGIVDLVVDGQTGALVKQLSVSAMHGAVDGLLSSPATLSAHGAQAFSEFQHRFSAESYQARWADVLSF